MMQCIKDFWKEKWIIDNNRKSKRYMVNIRKFLQINRFVENWCLIELSDALESKEILSQIQKYLLHTNDSIQIRYCFA